MKQEIKEFLEEIVENDEIILCISKKAQELLDQDLKEEVINIWGFDFENSWYKEESRKSYKNITKIDFIYEVKHDKNKEKFVEKNWNKIDQIIKILQDHIKEIEEQEELEKELEEKEQNNEQTNN